MSTDACGTKPAKGNGSYWTCTLAQDFDGTELDRSVWRPQTGFPSGSDSGRPCYVDESAGQAAESEEVPA